MYTRSKPNVIPEVDVPERLVRARKREKRVVLSCVTYSNVGICTEALSHGRMNTTIWELNRQDAGKFNEGIYISNEKSELYREWAQTTEYPTQVFATHLEIQDIVAPEMKRRDLRKMLMCLER